MPGTVLLLAASPLGRGRLVDAAGVLPVLAAVAPSVLSGTDTANVIELADPLEPQAVLTRLRAAAASPGPLTVYVTGQLHLDRRQHQPHLALARTTPATLRYTALPWHWIREELRLRSAADTALVVDLHADAEAWRHITGRGLDSGRNTAVYGRVAPATGRRGLAEPAYMKTVATLLRSGHRPPLGVLHEQAVARVAEEARGSLLLADAGGHVPGGPVGGFVRGAEAAGFPPGTVAPRTAADGGRAVVAGGPVRPAVAEGIAPGSSYGGLSAGSGDSGPPPGAQEPPAAVIVPAQADAPARVPGAPVPGSGSGAAEAGGGSPVPLPGGSGPGAGGSGVRPGGSVPHPSSGGAGDTGPALRPLDAPLGDPHAGISAAVQDGRHGEAEGIAARLEAEAVRAHGAASEQALHWSEVRADLAMLAGDAVRSCRAWLGVAQTRLAAGQAGDAPAVEAAVDRAHHQWTRIKDTARARELGPALAELRLRVPGRRRGALENVQRQLGRLQATP
ncbi:hypothetical protein [Streptomyces sp. NRRL B-3648]|uniref:hypothetical protein n=1 Tax=Streptomyces sp. NRRL B-3648 TaxID=1519493 RepID=UPI0006AE8E34|nr:hypothetical protein [Streptomyces sp. NRRL B-3648]KOV91936.1 hypothetical protein ADL04_32490 [Streptomyces sp. NRRL B-3648]